MTTTQLSNYIIISEDEDSTMLAPKDRRTGLARKTGWVIYIKATGQVHDAKV